MNRNGFTLVELIIVIAIIAALLSLVTINFHRYNVKYNIEKQTKEMEADLDNVRLQAIHQKNSYQVRFGPTSYTFARYSSETDLAGRVVTTRAFPYQIQTSGGNINFDARGMADVTGQQIWVVPTTNDVYYDCLVVSTAKINIGKRQTNGTCLYR